MSDDDTAMRVECVDCSFGKVVTVEEDETPADVLVDHGRQTGHTLNLTQVDG